MTEEVVQAVLKDWQSAPISEKLRLMLGFLEKLTLIPQEVGTHNVRPLRAAGISDQAIEDAIYVCAFFNIIDRIADALHFNVPPTEMFVYRASVTLENGYAFSSMPKPS